MSEVQHALNATPATEVPLIPLNFIKSPLPRLVHIGVLTSFRLGSGNAFLFTYLYLPE